MSRLCASRSKPVQYAEVLASDTLVIPVSDSKFLQVSTMHGVNQIQASRDEGLATSSDSHMDRQNSSQSDSETEVVKIHSTALNIDSETDDESLPASAYAFQPIQSLSNALSASTSPSSFDILQQLSPIFNASSLTGVGVSDQTSRDSYFVQTCADFLDAYSSRSSSCSSSPQNFCASKHEIESIQTSEAAVDFTMTLIKFGLGFLKYVPETVVREMRADDEAIAQRFMIDGNIGEQIASKIAAIYSNISNQPQKTKPIIMELTACCGGSVLQFAASGLFSRVDAVEKEKQRCDYLKYNYELLRDTKVKLCPLQVVNGDFNKVQNVTLNGKNYHKLNSRISVDGENVEEIPGQIFDGKQTQAQIIFYDPIWMNMFPDDLFSQIELSSKEDKQTDSKLVSEIEDILRDFGVNVKDNKKMLAVKCPRASFAIDDIVNQFSDEYFLLYHSLKKMTVVYFMPKDGTIEKTFQFKDAPLQPSQDCTWVNVGTTEPSTGHEITSDEHETSFLDENNRLTEEGRKNLLEKNHITIVSNSYFKDVKFFYRPEIGTRNNTLYKLDNPEGVICLYQEKTEDDPTENNNTVSTPNLDLEIFDWVDRHNLKETATKDDLSTIFGIANGKMRQDYNGVLERVNSILQSQDTHEGLKRMIWFFMRAILITPSRDDQAARLKSFNQLFKDFFKNINNIPRTFSFKPQKHQHLYLKFDHERQIMFSSLKSSLKITPLQKQSLDYAKQLDDFVQSSETAFNAEDYFYTAPFRAERAINQHDGQCKLAHAHCEFLFDHVYRHFFEENQTMKQFEDAISHLKLVYIGAANTKKPSGEVWTIALDGLTLRPELQIKNKEFLEMLKMNNFREFELPPKKIKIESFQHYDSNAWIQPFSMLSHFYRFNGHNLWNYVDPTERETLSSRDEIRDDSRLVLAFQPFKPRPKVQPKLYCQYALLRKKYAILQAQIQDGSWLELFGNTYVASGTRSERYLADLLKLFPTGDILLVDPQAINEVELRKDLGMHAGDGRLEVLTQNFTTKMCIRLAQSCRTLGTYWQECEAEEEHNSTTELLQRLTKSTRIAVEEVEELSKMNIKITPETIVKVNASALAWQLLSTDTAVPDVAENIIKIHSNDTLPRWEFFMTARKTVIMSLEEQEEFQTIMNSVATEKRMIKLQSKTWTCVQQEDGQNLIWSLQPASVSDEGLIDIFSMQSPQASPELTEKMKQKFIVPKTNVMLTEHQIELLKLGKITDETRLQVNGYSFYWTPRYKSRMLKPVLQTPVFISDARKDTVIRDKSIETAAVHALAKTIKNTKIEPPDFLPHLEYTPTKQFNHRTFIGPIFNSFFCWNAYTGKWQQLFVWHQSNLRQHAKRKIVVQINGKYYEAKKRKILISGHPSQLANLSVNQRDDLFYIPNVGVVQLSTNRGWVSVSDPSKMRGRYPDRIIGPIHGMYYETIQKWELISEDDAKSNTVLDDLQNFIIGPIGDDPKNMHYYQKRRDIDKWKKIDMNQKLFKQFQQHLKQGQTVEQFVPKEVIDCTIGPYDGYYYHFDKNDGTWSKEIEETFRKHRKETKRKSFPASNAFENAVKLARSKVDVPMSGFTANDEDRCARSIKSLVFNAVVNAEETCASYVNNAIWLLILTGFFHGEEKVKCFANIKTSLTTFAALAPRLPLLFDKIENGKSFVERLIEGGLIAEFLPGAAEGFGCRPHAMESRHWVSYGQSMQPRQKHEKISAKTLDKEFDELQTRIRAAITCETRFMSLSEMLVLSPKSEINFELFSSGREPKGMLDATQDFDVVVKNDKKVFILKDSHSLPRHVSPGASPLVYVQIANEYYVPKNTYFSFERIRTDLFERKIGTDIVVLKNSYEKLMQRDYAQKKILDNGRTPWVPQCQYQNCPSESQMQKRVSDLLNKRLSLIAINSLNTTPKSQPTMPRFEQKLEAVAIYDRILELWYQSRRSVEKGISVTKAETVEKCAKDYLKFITNAQVTAAQNYEKLTWASAMQATVQNFYQQQKSMIQWRDKMMGPFWLTGYIFPEHIQKIFEMLYWVQIDVEEEKNAGQQIKKYFQGFWESLETRKPEQKAQDFVPFAAILQTLQYGTRDLLPYLNTLRTEIKKFLDESKHYEEATILANKIPRDYRMYIQNYAYSKGTRKFLSRVEKDLAIRFFNYLPISHSGKYQNYLNTALLRPTRNERVKRGLPEIPMDMWGEFDMNRVFLYARYSVHDWPSGDIGKSREYDLTDPGRGFFALHRIIETDAEELLTVVLKSSAFGYSNKIPEKQQKREYVSDDAKNQPALFSSLEEKLAAWIQCIAIVTDFCVPRCAQKLCTIFVQQQAKYESSDDVGDSWPQNCLQSIRTQLDLRSRLVNETKILDQSQKPNTIVKEIADTFLEAITIFEQSSYDEMPGSGKFFGKQYMSSLCSTETVKPYIYNVGSGEDFMVAWVFMLYFCKKIYPIELFCCIHQVSKIILGQISKRKDNGSKRQRPTFQDLRRNGRENKPRNENVKSAEEDLQTLFNTEGKLFDFDIKTFMKDDWHEKLSKEMKKTGEDQSKFLLNAFSLCVMLKDNIQRFMELSEFEKETKFLFSDEKRTGFKLVQNSRAPMYDSGDSDDSDDGVDSETD